ncbi:MAG: CDGSH iron-sulfur domain-containing protein [Terriglobales bacterium]
MADVTITTKRNGPFLVEGPIKLIDSTGAEITVNKPVISLCRCGGSVNKPFCDGTHSKVGFQGAEAAVLAAEQAKTSQP